MLELDRSTAQFQTHSVAVSSSLHEYFSEEDQIRHIERTIPRVLRNGTAAHATDSYGIDRLAEKEAGFSNSEPLAEETLRILNFPRRHKSELPTRTLYPLQEWEGYIVEIRTSDFVARLVDLTAGSICEEEAVIPLAEVSDKDAAKMDLGSIFRWVIGYERSLSGTKKRVSQIVFRDLPAFTETDLRAGQTWASEIVRLLKP